MSRDAGCREQRDYAHAFHSFRLCLRFISLFD
jgi:hypothetical protein